MYKLAFFKFRDYCSDPIFTPRTEEKFYLNIFNGFVIQNDFIYEYNSGLTGDYNPNSYLWNISIGKKILNNGLGEIRLSAYDILNKNINIQRNITDSYTEDTNTNVLGRYFLLSFIYNIRSF